MNRVKGKVSTSYHRSAFSALFLIYPSFDSPTGALTNNF
jgi:hypothetical protein